MTFYRYNPFTRGLLLAVSILSLSVVLYFGRECAASNVAVKQAAACQKELSSGNIMSSTACRKTTAIVSRRLLTRLAGSRLARFLDPEHNLPTQSG